MIRRLVSAFVDRDELTAEPGLVARLEGASLALETLDHWQRAAMSRDAEHG
jgi:hypothetical protein